MGVKAGMVYKNIGGFYYVKTEGAMVECKPRGIFRNRGQKIVAGDYITLAEEAQTLYIDTLLERKSHFIRPPVANVDQLVIVASTVEPTPSQLVIDKLTVTAFEQKVQPIIAVTKTDIESPAHILGNYHNSGIQLVVVDAKTGEGLPALHQLLQNKLSVFCGNSGVGKSTLLNALFPSLALTTGEISQKLGRGRHTTREVEIFEEGDCLIADTPGFASLNLQQTNPVLKENLQFDFPEIASRFSNCRYTGCSHIAEAGCAVREALAKGEIAAARYQSYTTLYEDAKQNEKY